MRRLSEGDWGDTPLHELSHTFDYDGWTFDRETLAQLKLYYIISTLDAKVYRPDRFNNSGKGWYTGENYYNLLKRDRYLDSYTNSFDKGVYASEGFAAVFVEIQRKIGWEAFKKTFRYFSELSYNQLPQKDGEKLKLFLTKLKDYSGKDVLSYISSRDKNIVNNHFGITLEYVVPSVLLAENGDKAVISADKGGYAVYAFTPSKSGNYYIYTSPYADNGVSNDTYIEVYENADLSKAPIASNDDYGGVRFSKVSIAATEGKTYYVKVRHYKDERLLAEINIQKDVPVEVLVIDETKDTAVNNGEYVMYEFTPSQTNTYVMKVDGYGGGKLTYDTYIKLYEDEKMTKRIGNDERKIMAKLKGGHKYYLQFSGFLMKYARWRINVSQGQTLQFTKRTDSSFIYVNSPEYITRIDIVDDECHTKALDDERGHQKYLKIFEQENVTGKNTYYQTHTAWWGAKPEIYEQISNFYIDIDMYNPTSNDIIISINNLTYGTEYNVLENYYNGRGITKNITIPAYEHRLLFKTLNKPLLMSYPGDSEGNGWNWERHRSPIILFDFEVSSGNIVLSSLAAYNNKNLYLRNGSKNIIEVFYSSCDIMNIFGNLQANEDYLKNMIEEIFEVKPTYETEAEQLKADGLLVGNEKGLDLLKPLTRIEAMAILVRAMGLENESTSEISYFTDISSDNWGAKYANIAKDKGIAEGIGEDKFAPNETITSSQFASLILRNMGENPDWQTAIDIFVERGLITSEQAEKMDLFTRGDMAKIIYEAKQKQMF